MILDEATSDVDPETEEQIQRRPGAAAEGAHLFPHRPPSGHSAHGGPHPGTAGRRIAEQGTHQQLLDAGGIYRVLYDAQFSLTAPGFHDNTERRPGHSAGASPQEREKVK